jgi:hypothetical protein
VATLDLLDLRPGCSTSVRLFARVTAQAGPCASLPVIRRVWEIAACGRSGVLHLVPL